MICDAINDAQTKRSTAVSVVSELVSVDVAPHYPCAARLFGCSELAYRVITCDMRVQRDATPEVSLST